MLNTCWRRLQDMSHEDRQMFAGSVLVKKIIYILLMFGIYLKWTQGVIIIIFIWRQAFCYWLMFWKSFLTCLECHQLDPCHYFSSPGLSWDAMLKMTGIELELITDIEMQFLLKKEWREVFLTSLKDSKTNNKYMKCYDSSKENKFIIYLDAENLYAWAMRQYLPYSGFKVMKINMFFFIEIFSCIYRWEWN